MYFIAISCVCVCVCISCVFIDIPQQIISFHSENKLRGFLQRQVQATETKKPLGKEKETKEKRK